MGISEIRIHKTQELFNDAVNQTNGYKKVREGEYE